METQYYFGYGVLKNRNLIKEIIGRDPGPGRSAILRGFQLGYQSLQQIPPSVSTQLQKIWGDSFKAYTLVKGNGVVSGTVWELTKDELFRIGQWNFIGVWRTLSEDKVILDDNTELTVSFDVAPSSQGIEGIILNGIEGVPSLLSDVIEGKIKLDEYLKEQEHEIENAREMLQYLSQRPSESSVAHT